VTKARGLLHDDNNKKSSREGGQQQDLLENIKKCPFWKITQNNKKIINHISKDL
jgi:hypothetical protein